MNDGCPRDDCSPRRTRTWTARRSGASPSRYRVGCPRSVCGCPSMSCHGKTRNEGSLYGSHATRPSPSISRWTIGQSWRISGLWAFLAAVLEVLRRLMSLSLVSLPSPRSADGRRPGPRRRRGRRGGPGAASSVHRAGGAVTDREGLAAGGVAGARAPSSVCPRERVARGSADPRTCGRCAKPRKC